MMNPEAYGVTEPALTALGVTKQKLDWTANVDMGLPEVSSLITMLQSLGIISQAAADTLRDTPDRTEYDQYTIYVKAQDDITVNNIYGAVFDGNLWKVVMDYYNNTKDIHIIEDAYFSSEPTTEEITLLVNDKLTELKREV
jgi:hypothetical protein